MSDYLKKCFDEARINGLILRNRLIKAATFEGKSPNGIPGESHIRLHERMGEGGIALTTVGYCAAESDGRINENMIYMHDGIKPQLQQLIARVHATGAKVSGQLSHCGNFTKSKAFSGRGLFSGKRPMGPSFGINSLGMAYGLPFTGAMTVAEIKDRVKVFGRAAAFMKSTGFDAIEIHFGHGYGISQFISPRTNKRTDEYGGSLANRMRFALEVLEEVRKNVGDDFPLLGKISMTDGVKGGVHWNDSVEIASMLDKGGLDCVICSAGTSSMNPMIMFHGDNMLPNLIKNEKSPIMKLGMKMVGPKLFRDYPYKENYLLEHARRIREKVGNQVCYIGGVCSNDSIEALMKEGFDFIQLGRPLFFDPDFPNNAKADVNYVNGCTHCNECAGLIEAEGGVRCVLNEHFS
ncbi:MAG: NADH:flavin oxidoreductase [Pseudomonadales bacterium]|nr:NADH:flavin oxidoreductase [Pseudomonadales bacterium]